jgi:ATP-dependent helicase/nuclease subunit B
MEKRRRPRVCTVPSGVPFTDALAAGILNTHGDDPFELGRVLVLLPTRRACRSLRESFLRVRKGAPLLLPRIQPIADIDEEELALHWIRTQPGSEERLIDIPPAIPSMRRQLLLSRLILHVHAQRHDHDVKGMDPAQSVALAAELASLLDRMQTERLAFSELERVVPDQLAAHWQQTLDFLKILTEHWPRVLASEDCIDPADRRNRLLELQVRVWERSPPEHPVIAAGSTGTVPATADLLKVVATLPNGWVVLPGLDQWLDEKSWRSIDETHYQFGLRELVLHLGVHRFDILNWMESEVESHHRPRFLSEVLRPAETTHEWLQQESLAKLALSGVNRIDCPGPEEEARVIALVMREALETPGRTAALVTPDRSLARRVAAEVRRWDIEIDDSAGQALGETTCGIFMRLVATLAAERLSPVSLLAALKHPFASAGRSRQEFQRLVRSLELAVLRGARPGRDIDGLLAAVKLSEQADELLPFVQDLGSRLSGMLVDSHLDPAPIADVLRRHVSACEALAAGEHEDGAAQIWAGEAGEELAGFIDELHQASMGLAPILIADYAALLTRLLAGRVVRPRWGLHPRLHIWGLLEARLQSADVMILGGLNEGSWPPETKADPWLSRPMRASVGLPAPERRIGQTAHDFVQALSASEVFLTRSEKVEGTPTVPSRWLLRIETFFKKSGQQLIPDRPWMAWQGLLDQPDAPSNPALPPEPCPPLEARPRRLSVTDIETWVRDPYALFAKRILGLRPLEPIDADPGTLERGVFIHRALEEFIAANGDDLPPDSVQRLIAIGEKVFGATLAQPAVWSFWWPRYLRIADWFVGQMLSLASERGAVPVAVEVRGAANLDTDGEPFELVSKADRIDMLADGSLVIVDYKTGSIPTQKDIEMGLSPQLPLEAWIAQLGGFHGIDPATISEVCYWRLTGGAKPGQVVSVRKNVGDLIQHAHDGLQRLVAAFDNPATPYRARPRPRHATRFGEYDHLARVAEWSVDGDSTA